MHSPERALGVDMAEELRNRISGENSERDLHVVSKVDINNFLTQSGYQPDSAVSITDLKELSKGVRGDEFLDGTVSRASGGVHLEVRLYLTEDIAYSQPLDPVTGKDVGDAAKLLERELTEARKQIPDTRRCMNLYREGNRTPDAVKAAYEAEKAYPRATIARACLARIYIQAKYAPDSTLRVADEIIKFDPDNLFAWRLRFKAYQDKKDDAGALAAALKLRQMQPGDADAAATLIQLLVASNDAEKALPIIDELLAQNQGDPILLNTKWRLLLKLERRKDAIPVGEMMVRSDTSLADSLYYFRQMYSALQDSNWAKAAEFGGAGAKKFTKDADFPYQQANAYRKLGKIPEAIQAYRHTLTLNPTDPKPSTLRLLLATEFTELNQLDSVVALSRVAIAAGDDKKNWGTLMLKPTQAAFAAAQASKSVDDFRASLALAQYADSLDSSPTSHFFIGVSAFQIGIDALQKLQTEKTCANAHTAEDYFTIAQLNMPAGGSVDAGTAKQVLDLIAQYSGPVAQMVKAYCK
jgi:tetratricopeptide (TPR) repeat protein